MSLDRDTREGSGWDRLVALVRAGAIHEAPSSADVKWLEDAARTIRWTLEFDAAKLERRKASDEATEALRSIGVEVKHRAWIGSTSDAQRHTRPLTAKATKNGPRHLLRLGTGGDGSPVLVRACNRRLGGGRVLPRDASAEYPGALCERCVNRRLKAQRRMRIFEVVYVEVG